MATFEPWAVDDTPLTTEHHSPITTMLSADIETFTTFKDTLKATPIKAIFESVIVILTLVRVGFLSLFSYSRNHLPVIRPGRDD